MSGMSVFTQRIEICVGFRAGLDAEENKKSLHFFDGRISENFLY